MRLEEYMENVVKTIVAARSDVSVPVVRFRDRMTSKGNDGHVTIRAYPAERQSPNHDKYFVKTDVMLDTQKENDPRAKGYDDLITAIADEINETMTTTTLQTQLDASYPSSGIVVDGIIYTDTADTDDSSQFQIYSQTITIAVTFTKP